MICYRRHGHNEADDPSYTQPILYRKIKEHPPVGVLYAERLVREKVIAGDAAAAMRKAASARLSEAFDAAQQRAEHYIPQELSAVGGEEIGSFCPRTAVNRPVLDRVVRGIPNFPPEFHLHPKLRGFIDRRRALLEKDAPIDWAFAEALAFGTLALEGSAIRLKIGRASCRERG